MIRHKSLTVLGTALTLLALLALNLPVVYANPPGNDDFNSATLIPSPASFSDALNTTEATASFDDPSCATFSPAATVWYALTPASGETWQISANTFGSDYATTFSVWTGSPGGFTSVACASSQVNFNAIGGITYYFMVGAQSGPYPGPGTGGNLMFQVTGTQLTSPANDNFANATALGALPFDGDIDLTAATLEAGEPAPACDGWANPDKTIWYVLTPNTSGSFTAYASAWFPTVLTVYTGNTVAGLSQVACRTYSSNLTFQATAGTTYYLQAGSLSGYAGSLHVHVEVSPPPVAAFVVSPSDPSAFDTPQFLGYYSYDPAGTSIQTYAWNFGDGATLTSGDCCPTHRYPTDGNYTVQLTVTTPDGRTASTSQSVSVRTHDVAITKFSVPTSARAGQTRQIVVGLRNSRYPETVRVDLYKSTPSGFQWIGFSEQTVPVRSGNRTTDFSFNYTFTNDDATIGKVNFKAVATIVSARDALPTDNESVSRPTKVAR